MKTKSRNHVGAQDILDDINTLANDAKLVFENNVTEPAADALASLRERLEAAQERLSDYYSTAKSKTIAGAKSTDAAIRDKPYHAIAIAAGAGLLLGLYLSRDRD